MTAHAIRFVGAAMLVMLSMQQVSWSQDRANELRERLIARAKSLQSFEGSFTHFGEVPSYEAEYVLEFTYRFSGENRYFSRDSVPDSAEEPIIHTEFARLDGVVSSLYFRLDSTGAYERAPQAIIGHEEWREEYDNLWLTPYHLVGLDGLTPEVQWSVGTFSVSTDGEHVILVQRYAAPNAEPPTTVCYDYWFDDTERLVRIEIGHLFGEAADALRGAGTFEPISVLELSDYRLVDGMDLPTLAEFTGYTGSGTERVVFGRRTLILDEDSVRVNPALSSDAFKIDFPDKTVINNRLIDEVIPLGRNTIRDIADLAENVRADVFGIESAKDDAVADSVALSTGASQQPGPLSQGKSPLTKVSRRPMYKRMIVGVGLGLATVLIVFSIWRFKSWKGRS